MAKHSIANVLGCLALITLISGCSTAPVKISQKPIDKPVLVLPESDRLILRNVEWVIVTPENVSDIMSDLRDSNEAEAIFGLKDIGYENLSQNLSDLMLFIQQQRIILSAYERYYQSSESALDEANSTIDILNKEVESVKTDNTSSWTSIFK